MFGNYKLPSDSSELQGFYMPKTKCRFMPYTDRKCQSQTPAWSSLFAFPLSLLEFFLLVHLFCSCSVKSPSVLPAPLSPLLYSGMCISAVFNERVVNRALLCSCVRVFHVSCAYMHEASRQDTRALSREQRGRRTWIVGITRPNSGLIRKTGDEFCYNQTRIYTWFSKHHAGLQDSVAKTRVLT